MLVALAIGVPLAFSHGVFNSYAAPKAVLLYCGAAGLVGLFTGRAILARRLPVPRTAVTIAMAAYAAVLCVVTARSVEPIISLQGSFSAQMGLLTWLSFLIVSGAVISESRRSPALLDRLGFAVVLTGGIVAAVGIAQFGYLLVSSWAVVAAGDESARVHATLGHPDFAGNLLLFPLFLGLSLRSAVVTRAKQWACGVSACLCATAVVLTGTRGAWVGALLGLALLAWLSGPLRLDWRSGKVGRGVVAVAGAIALAGVVILWTDAGAPVRSRASKIVTEGYSGAGRTTLWSFSIAMVPHYWLAGCGLETFRLAQIEFKTPEFEREMNGTVAEDPHSAYLSHLVATGLFATALYATLLGLTVWRLAAGLRLPLDPRFRRIGIGVACALLASLAHDVFLHHMIADGMYLFLFLGIANAWCDAAGAGRSVDSTLRRDDVRPEGRALRIAVAVGCSIPILAAATYSWRLVSAEMNIRRCMGAAAAGHDDLTRRYGTRATSVDLYQTDFHFLFGAALERLVERDSDTDSRQRLEMALAETQLARERTLSPVNCLVSSSLIATRLQQFESAAADLREAERVDPVSGLPHLGWSSYYFNRGQIDEAVVEFVKARSLGVRFEQAALLKSRLHTAVRKSPNKRRLKRLLTPKSSGPAGVIATEREDGG